MKKTFIALIAAFAVFAFAGCGSDFAKTYVQGSLDSFYKNIQTDEYLSLFAEEMTEEMTVEELQANYEGGMEVEADYFAYYFGIESLSEASEAAIIDMYKQIYASAKYEVADSVKDGESYTVEVTVYPIDIFDKVVKNDYDNFYNNIVQRGQDGEFNSLSDQEFYDLFVKELLDLFTPYLSNIEYTSPEKVSVKIEPDNKGIYYMDSEASQNIDSLIIYYP